MCILYMNVIVLLLDVGCGINNWKASIGRPISTVTLSLRLIRSTLNGQRYLKGRTVLDPDRPFCWQVVAKIQSFQSNIKSVGSHLNLVSDPCAATREYLFTLTCCPYKRRICLNGHSSYNYFQAREDAASIREWLPFNAWKTATTLCWLETLCCLAL